VKLEGIFVKYYEIFWKSYNTYNKNFSWQKWFRRTKTNFSRRKSKKTKNWISIYQDTTKKFFYPDFKTSLLVVTWLIFRISNLAVVKLKNEILRSRDRGSKLPLSKVMSTEWNRLTVTPPLVWLILEFQDKKIHFLLSCSKIGQIVVIAFEITWPISALFPNSQSDPILQLSN